MKQYTLKDISVIIPTIDRPEEVIETLKHIPNTIKEIIIVDQGKSINLVTLGEKLIHLSNIPIKVIESSPPSITIARNQGVQNSTGALVVFLDDDVTVSPNYFEAIIETFNIPDSKYQNLMGVAGWKPHEVSERRKIFECFIKRPFGLCTIGGGKNGTKLTHPYGNRYPFELMWPTHAAWFPGMNMVFKREVFDKMNMRFDENLLGYTIAEDIDFTYSLYKRNPESLCITPHATIQHRDAQGNRNSDPKKMKKLMYINTVDHLYFAMKHDMLGRWWWNIIGISIFRILQAIYSPIHALLTILTTPSTNCTNTINTTDTTNTTEKWKHYFKYSYFFSSLKYCFKHWSLIKRGKLRE